MNNNRLHHRYGPRALVTGASSGIGREMAVQLAAAGLDLTLVARREAALRALAGELATTHGIDVHALPLDLSSTEDVDDLVAATAGVDIGLYVAAAGFGTSGPFLTADPASERDMLPGTRLAASRWLYFGSRAGQRSALV